MQGLLDGMSVPRIRTEPGPQWWQSQVLTPWTAGEFPLSLWICSSHVKMENLLGWTALPFLLREEKWHSPPSKHLDGWSMIVRKLTSNHVTHHSQNSTGLPASGALRRSPCDVLYWPWGRGWSSRAWSGLGTRQTWTQVLGPSLPVCASVGRPCHLWASFSHP